MLMHIILIVMMHIIMHMISLGKLLLWFLLMPINCIIFLMHMIMHGTCIKHISVMMHYDAYYSLL